MGEKYCQLIKLHVVYKNLVGICCPAMSFNKVQGLAAEAGRVESMTLTGYILPFVEQIPKAFP